MEKINKRYHKILAIARQVCSWHNYKDVTHDYLLTCYEHGRNILSEEYNDSYIRAGLRRKRVDIWRSIHTTEELLDEHLIADNAIEAKMLIDEVYARIEKCSDEWFKKVAPNRSKFAKTAAYKFIIDLHISGLSERNIANELVMKRETVGVKKKQIFEWIKDLNPYD